MRAKEGEIRKGLGKYHAVYEHDAKDGGWTVHITEADGCITEGESIAQARRRVRAALELFFADAASAKIVDDVRLPKNVDTLRSRFVSAHTAATAAQQAATELSREAVRRLVLELGLSMRDSAELLGISHQRVAQLADELAATKAKKRRAA